MQHTLHAMAEAFESVKCHIAQCQFSPLQLNGGMLSPTSPSSPSGAVYPSLHQIPTAPPIDIHGGVANQVRARRSVRVCVCV